MNTNVNPALQSLLVSLRIFLLVLGTWMAHDHIGSPGLYHGVLAASGVVVDLGTAAWGVYASFQNFRKALAVGAQAGINLTISGRAVDEEGKPISSLDPDATPPRPVTLTSAAQIVKNFGPAPSEIKAG